MSLLSIGVTIDMNIDSGVSKCVVSLKREPTYTEVIDHIKRKSIQNFNNSVELMTKEFLTPNSISLGCDLYFGPITEYQMVPSDEQFYYSRYLPHFMDCLEPGVVLLVSLNWLDHFFRFMYDQINVPFVLVTGGYSDSYAPGAIKLDHVFNDIRQSKIIHWFSINCNHNPDPNRFTCIPLGMYALNVYGPSAIPTLKKFAAHTVFAKHSPSHITSAANASYDIIVSFNVNSIPRLRAGIWNMFCGGTLEDAVTMWTTPFLFTNSKNITALCFNRIELAKTYDIITRNKFVLSPHGAGLDCYRTWETLLLGGYPVVMEGSLDSMYHDLPVLILDNWDDLTLDLLQKTAIKFSSTNYTYESLYTSYYTRGLFRRFGYEQYEYQRTELNAYVVQVMERLGVADGDLVKGEQETVYLIRNHTRCPISGEVFARMKFSFWAVKKLKDIHLTEIPPGPEVL